MADPQSEPRERAPRREPRPGAGRRLENFLRHLVAELDACGFLRNQAKRPSMVRTIRHLFERGEVTEQELRTLRAQIVSALPQVTDRASRLHLEDARDQIDEILDPRAMRDRAGAGRAGGGGPAATGFQSPEPWTFDYDNDPFWNRPVDCWPDYASLAGL